MIRNFVNIKARIKGNRDLKFGVIWKDGFCIHTFLDKFSNCLLALASVDDVGEISLTPLPACLAVEASLC